jgi:hypothetical protein
MEWYVYRVNVNGQLGYIGKGHKSRYLISARRLNGIAGILEWFRHEGSALRREKQLIAAFKPPFNKTKGGEGDSRLMVKDPIRRELTKSRDEAYKRADKTNGCLSILAAAVWARSELNSRGIKWPEGARGPEPEDPEVVEAIKRLNVWKQLKPLAYRLWDSYFKSSGTKSANCQFD